MLLELLNVFINEPSNFVQFVLVFRESDKSSYIWIMTSIAQELLNVIELLLQLLEELRGKLARIRRHREGQGKRFSDRGRTEQELRR